MQNYSVELSEITEKIAFKGFKLLLKRLSRIKFTIHFQRSVILSKRKDRESLAILTEIFIGENKMLPVARAFNESVPLEISLMSL